jgi:tRNA pseudouridine55 synthase
MFGFLIVNKTAGPTSHDVVGAVRRIAGIRRVGHSGTLDPFATGVLLVGVGREATREFPKLVGLDKHYRALVRLGATSDTNDRTGQVAIQESGRKIQVAEIESALKKFTGRIEQIPPMYSAKKIAGQKLYELARAGKTIERAPVPVEVYAINCVSYDYPSLTLDIHCGSGTYIRAIARDLGTELGCGAYLEELERTAVGPFGIEEAVKLADLDQNNWANRLISPNEAIARCHPPATVLG